MIVRAAPREHYDWIATRTGCELTSSFRAIEAVDEHGAIHAMVAYASWTPNSVQMHVAIDTPIAGRHLLVPAFEYPFTQGGCGLVTGLIAANNARSIKLAKRLGFRQAHRIKDGWSVGVDLILHEMTRDECRWLRPARKVA